MRIKTIIIKVSLGFSCPNHSCKITFGWALSVSKSETCGLNFLWNTPGGQGAVELGSQLLRVCQTPHISGSHPAGPQQSHLASLATTLLAVPSRCSLTIRLFSWSVLVASRMLLTPPTYLTGLWKRDQCCNEVSGWLQSYLDQQAIFAAITMTFTSKPTVREVFQLDFQMGKYFAFVEDEGISGPTCIRFHYHPIFMLLM